MIKAMRRGQTIEMGARFGFNAASNGVARAAHPGALPAHGGLEGICRLPADPENGLIFDATSASAHPNPAAALAVWEGSEPRAHG